MWVIVIMMKLYYHYYGFEVSTQTFSDHNLYNIIIMII